MGRIVSALGLMVALVPAIAQAGEFYVDPVHGRSDNDGSSSAPWRSLQEILDKGLIESREWQSFPYTEGAKLVAKNAGAPVKGGDTIFLRSGYHGDVRVMGFYNGKDLTVVAQEGHEPRFRSVFVGSGSHWVFRGLHVSPEYASSYERTLLFNVASSDRDGPIHDIVVEDCQLQSVADSSGWSATDWDSLSCDGFEAGGKHITIRNNTLKNVNFGISVGASDSLIEGNLVENFAGDGMRGFGAHTVFQYNTVKNCYGVNENHDDGFQSWSFSERGVGTGEVVGIVLRGNIFVNYEDPNQPYRGTMQGIGCFDGTYVDWVVENNLVIVDHAHGISFYGARNTRIVNNTVLDPQGQRHGPPWILITAHKDGTPSTGSIIRNNLTTAISLDKKQAGTADHNLIIKDRTKLFADVAVNDFHLKKGSKAVNAASPKMAPNIDIEKVPRPWGDGYDIGAYEYHEGDVTPEKGESDSVESVPDPTFGPAAVPSPDLMATKIDESTDGIEHRESTTFPLVWVLGLAVLSLLSVVWLVRH